MGASVQIAVLSDTHGLLRREVVAELQDCSHIIHAGDIIREKDLDETPYGATMICGWMDCRTWPMCFAFRLPAFLS